MKRSVWLFLFLFWIIVASSCGSDKQKKEESCSSENQEIHVQEVDGLLGIDPECNKFLGDYKEFAFTYLDLANKFKANPKDTTLSQQAADMGYKMAQWSNQAFELVHCDSEEYNLRLKEIDEILFEAIDIIDSVIQ